MTRRVRVAAFMAVTVVTTALVVPLASVGAAHAGATLGAVRTIASGINQPAGMVTGPDGNLWFTNFGNSSIARMTPAGVTATFAGQGVDEPRKITTGPDGNLWFTNYGSDSIGRITPTGEITSFTAAGIDDPEGIASGADGNLWFTSVASSSIGRVTPEGVVSTFTDPGIWSPRGIAAGPDGNLWFTSYASDSIGRITPAGVISLFTDATVGGPEGITAGPDGNMWFANHSSIGRITPAGVISSFVSTVDMPISPEDIVTGSDGNLWFNTTPYSSRSIGRIAPGGMITTFDVVSTGPRGIAAGPDGNVWFGTSMPLEPWAVKRITPSGAVATFPGPGISTPGRITTGPDGSLWFTNGGNSSIGRVTPEGAVSRFTDPRIRAPFGITPGPDGNLWFTQYESSTIGRISPAGEVAVFSASEIYRPLLITAGPDGNLWFTNHQANWIGRITPAGEVARFYGPGIYGAYGITAGADGNLWFANANNDSIGRVTPAGEVSNFTGAGISDPHEIVSSADGNLWFNNFGNRSIGRITPAGVVSSFPVPGTFGIYGVADIAADPTGNIWFTKDGLSFDDDSIGRLAPSGVISTFKDVSVRDPFGLTAGPDGNMWFTTALHSIGVVGTGLPGAPREVSVSVGDGRATVSWSPPARDGGSAVTGYRVVASPGGQSCTPSAGSLSCTITGLSVAASYRFTVTAANGDGPGPGRSSAPIVPVTSGVGFHPITPARILDSRPAEARIGAYATPWSPGQVRDVALTGAGGVPPSATAVVVNITVTGTTSPGYLTVWPAGQSRPLASGLNWASRETVANAVTVKVGVDGLASVFNFAGNAHVIIDAMGYYDASGGDGLTSLPPARISDSRLAGGPWGAGQTQDVGVTGAGGVPVGADAVVVNVTVTGTTAAGYVTIWPTGQARPLASNLNWTTGQTIANAVTVQAGPDGRVSIFNAYGSAHVILDVVGYFSPGSGHLFHPVSPVRVQDSRPGGPAVGTYRTPWGPMSSRDAQVAGTGGIPVGASAALLNITATGGTAASYLTITPGGPLPLASALTWRPGQTVPNASTTKLSPAGRISIGNAYGSVDVIADTAGWYG